MPNTIGAHPPAPNLFLELNRVPKEKLKPSEKWETPAEDSSEAGHLERSDSTASTEAPSEAEGESSLESLATEDFSVQTPSSQDAEVGLPEFPGLPETTPSASTPQLMASGSVKKKAKATQDMATEPTVNLFRYEHETAMGLPEQHPRHPNAKLSNALKNKSKALASSAKAVWSKPVEALKASSQFVKGLVTRTGNSPFMKGITTRTQALAEKTKAGSARVIQKSGQMVKNLGSKSRHKWSQIRSQSSASLAKLKSRIQNLGPQDPLRGLPKNLKQDPKFMEGLQPFQNAVKETQKATRAYQIERAKSLGQVLAGSALAVGVTTGLGAALGALLQTLTLSQKMQVTSTEEGEVGEAEETAGLPDLGVPGEGFEPLTSTSPEVGGALEEAFSYLFPDQNPELIDKMGPESQEAVQEMMNEFKLTYNSVPEGEREAFLENFASEAQAQLERLSHDYENLITNTRETWLQSEKAEVQIEASLAKALASVDNSPAPETPKLTTSTSIEQNPAEGSMKGVQMGAVFGASLGAAGLLALLYKKRKTASASSTAPSPLKTKRQLMEAKQQVQTELYNQTVKPHLTTGSATSVSELSTNSGS